MDSALCRISASPVLKGLASGTAAAFVFAACGPRVFWVCVGRSEEWVCRDAQAASSKTANAQSAALSAIFFFCVFLRLFVTIEFISARATYSYFVP